MTVFLSLINRVGTITKIQSDTPIQCSRCNPVGDNVTWPRITLQKNTLILVTILPTGQDRNRNQCIICNVTKYTCILVTILPEADVSPIHLVPQ